MFFTILLNCVGILAGTPVINSQYPTYKTAFSYESNISCTGPSYIDEFGTLYISQMVGNVTGTVYANGVNDYYLELSTFDTSIHHYSVDDDETYTLDYSINFSRDNLSGLKINPSNIDNDGYLSFKLEYSDDVIEASLTTPLRVVYFESETFAVNNQILPYVSYDYRFSFQADFKQQLESFITIGLNALDNYDRGFNDGYNEGFNTGTSDGYNNGYSEGYTVGYNLGASQDETAVAIFSGIISIALIPINFFLACLNFEVFGINIGAFVSAMLTVAIVVIITRIIVAGGNGGDK